MKIIFRISYMGFGGAEQVFISLAKEWMNEHDVMFVTDKNHGSSFDTLLELGIKVKSLDCKRTLLSVGKFKNAIEEYQPDIILSAYPDTNAACILSAKLAKTKAKVFVSEHASIVEHFANKSKFARFKVNAIVKYLYPLSDKVIAVSKGVMEDLIPLVNKPNKCTFIHNPIRFQATPNEHKEMSHNETCNILAVGRVTPQKDYSTLLKAMKELRAVKPNAKLTILGGTHDQQEMDKLKALAKTLDVTDIISFAGFSDDPASFYKNADIFVLSSAWEGFGNVIVEALAFGLPVVSTDCRSGPSEILENGKYGSLVPVSDHLSLAKAIIGEYQSPSCSVHERRTRASHFSEDNVAKKYMDLFLDYEKGNK